MTEVIIRRSGGRGGAVVLAVIMLAVLIFARNGARIGTDFDRAERELEQRRNLERIRNGDDIARLKKAIEPGGPLQNRKSFEEFLEALRKERLKPSTQPKTEKAPELPGRTE